MAHPLVFPQKTVTKNAYTTVRSAISTKTLLWVNAFAPALLLVVVCDWMFFGSKTVGMLPTSSAEVALFATAITLPHILASFMTFFDREYVSTYSRLLWSALMVPFVGLIVASLVGPTAILFGFATLTVAHVILQQVGISKMLLRHSTPQLGVWKWLLVAFGLATYLIMLGPQEHHGFWMVAAGITAILSSLCCCWVLTGSGSPGGKQHITATQFVVVAVFVSVLLSAPLVAVLIARLVHDLTAFLIYSNHENNRTLNTPSAFASQAQTALRISPTFWVVSLSVVGGVVLAFGATLSSNIRVLLMICFLAHYYLEAQVWKKGTLHRQHLGFEIS